MINRKKLYDAVRKDFFNGKLSQAHVDNIEAILLEWEKTGRTDFRQLGYVLGTVYHETAKTMQPIEEYGRGAGRPYGKKIRMDRKPYTTPDKLFYGRGHVQLTWYENYEKMGKLLGIDLLNHPEYALNPFWSVKIMFEGMFTAASAKGDFTGRHLDQFFNAKTEDWLGARKIINGMDQSDRIAGYAKKFYAALKA